MDVQNQIANLADNLVCINAILIVIYFDVSFLASSHWLYQTLGIAKLIFTRYINKLQLRFCTEYKSISFGH